MLKPNNMSVLLVVSVALFLLCSSVNMLPARSFLESITDNSKRQGGLTCPFQGVFCTTDLDCINAVQYTCRSKFFINHSLAFRTFQSFILRVLID